MEGTDRAARERVWGVVHAARRIADRSDPVGREARKRLVESSGLSPAGVELALCRHLETHPATRAVDKLLRGAGQARRCHVVLAANVCIAALRALACAAATAAKLQVYPSRRDPVVAELLVGLLKRSTAFARAGGHVELGDTLRPTPGDEVHAYGRDETLARIVSGLPAGVRALLHGTGFGLALVDAHEDTAAAAAAIAQDVVPFDQRGCLSPRIALVEGEAERAQGLAECLHEALGQRGAAVPRGPLPRAERGALRQHLSVMEAVGQTWEGPCHAVSLDPTPRTLALPPASRCVHVVSCSPKHLPYLLQRWAPYVAAIGHSGHHGAATRALRDLCPDARRSALGQMQRPALDGPVDGRTAARSA